MSIKVYRQDIIPVFSFSWTSVPCIRAAASPGSFSSFFYLSERSEEAEPVARTWGGDISAAADYCIKMEDVIGCMLGWGRVRC